MALVVIVQVAPAPVALAAFVVALSVVHTKFLAIDVGIIIDCCVPLSQEEDHRLPPPSGKVPSWPSSPSFDDCRRRRRTTPPLPRHSFASAASRSPSLFTRFFPHIQRNRITSKEKAGNAFFYLRHNFLRKRVQFLRFGEFRSGTFAHTNKKRNYGNHLLAIIIGSLSHHPSSNVE
jgi:hypothetical protein